jgi:hypothetical protein
MSRWIRLHYTEERQSPGTTKRNAKHPTSGIGSLSNEIGPKMASKFSIKALDLKFEARIFIFS